MPTLAAAAPTSSPRDNLGEVAAQVAGAALLTDYILTVAVSISSGVAQLVSAVPALEVYKVEFAVVLVLLIMAVNLRGVKESGITFSIPTYFFVVMMLHHRWCWHSSAM